MWSLLSGRSHPALDAARTDSTAGLDAGSPPSFAVDANAVPAEVFGLASYLDSTSVAPRIDRGRAIQVPAVKRSRDLICGTLGTLPLELFGPDKRKVAWSLFEQPERNVPRSVTMTNTFEDMFFEKVAWWRVVERYWNGWPKFVEHVKPKRVSLDEVSQKVYIDGKHVEDADLIRFYGPTDGLLIAGARSIRTCLLLDDAAANMADGVPPVDYFTPAEGIDPADDDVIAEVLADWQDARRARSTAYVPAALKYHRDGLTAEELQLHDSRQHAVIEIARLSGIDPEDLGVSTTSRTYQNGFERRKALIDFTFAPYMIAAQDTLSMRNVTPQGFTAVFNPDGLLRADAASRWASYEVGLRVGAISAERIAEIEGVPVKNVRALPPSTAKPVEEPRAV